jgi:hypothetical protein
MVLAGPVVAADFGGGAGAFVVVMLLFVVAAGLFVAMSGSLRRMRSNVTRGEFRGTTHPASPAPSDSSTPPASPADRESAAADAGHASADSTTVPPQR